MKNTTLPLAFVFAFVSLYSSMTCTRVTARAAEPVIVTKAQSAPEAPVLLANTAPAEVQRPAAENTGSDNGPRVARFLQKLREYQLFWAQYPVKRPDFIKGIYLTNATAANTRSLAYFLRQSKKHGINTLVIDAQGKPISADQMAMIKSAGIYPVARIVCFDLGLKQKYPEEKHIDKIMASVERAAKSGFREIQLDYIRYADEKRLQRLPLKFKYDQIAKVLARARKLTDSLGVELGADVFGRITLNENDHIGQKLELFGQYVHNLYPMVYPSHYYGDPEKIANPYGTVKEGVENSLERIPHTRIIPYIQGFAMKIKPSGLTLPQYILKQLFAVDDAQGHGYVIWNARNDYSATWKALKEYDRLAPKRKQQKLAQAQGK
jgi:hypothetical protein